MKLLLGGVVKGLGDRIDLVDVIADTRTLSPVNEVNQVIIFERIGLASVRPGSSW